MAVQNKYIQFQNANKFEPVAGEYLYALSTAWLNKFNQAYRQKAKQFRTKINNDSLVFQGNMKRTLRENTDYILVSSKAWEIIHNTYGGGPTVKVPILIDPKNGKPTPCPIFSKLLVFYKDKQKLLAAPPLMTIFDFKKVCTSSFEIEDKIQIQLQDFWQKKPRSILEDDKIIRELKVKH